MVRNPRAIYNGFRWDPVDEYGSACYKQWVPPEPCACLIDLLEIMGSSGTHTTFDLIVLEIIDSFETTFLSAILLSTDRILKSDRTRKRSITGSAEISSLTRIFRKDPF